MKYSELEKKLKKAGCYDTGEQMNGHPVWYSPITDQKFKTSNHKSQEVKKRNIEKYIKISGGKISPCYKKNKDYEYSKSIYRAR